MCHRKNVKQRNLESGKKIIVRQRSHLAQTRSETRTHDIKFTKSMTHISPLSYTATIRQTPINTIKKFAANPIQKSSTIVRHRQSSRDPPQDNAKTTRKRNIDSP